MTGSFASINTALTALRYQQLALDVASTNVANVGTDGYVRRRVVGETIGSSPVPALWSTSQDMAGGVQASPQVRMNDPLLDSRVRREHGRQAYLDGRSDAMARIETGLAEPGDNGVAAALATFKSTLHDLSNAPTSAAARSQVLAAAATVADAVRLQANHLSDEASDQRAHVLTSVDQINAVATQLASTNKTISAASAGASDTTTLMDTRDALALRLAELTGGTATERADGGMDVTVGAVSLVTGFTASHLDVTGGIAPDGSATGGPVTFALDGNAVTMPGGDMAATVEVLDDVIPGYLGGLNAVAEDLASQVNGQQALGYDDTPAHGPGAPVFGYDPADPAGSLKVVMTDPSGLAASSLPGGVADGGNAVAIADAIKVEDSYQRLVNGFGSQVAAAKGLSDNQQALTTQVDSAREQLAGVSLDEETVNIVSAQHAYESAARVMTTLDSVLDTLINHTGLVH